MNENRLLFLGTGAADGYSMVFPESFENRSLRRCTCTMLGEHTLIDCGPHILGSARAAGVELSQITDILFTHTHGDHFDEHSIEAVAQAGDRFLNLWVREDAKVPPIPGCLVFRMKPKETYEVGSYSVTGLAANHTYFPQHLSIEFDGKKLFYGLDGAWLLNEEVYFMQDKNYDVMVLDCTVGDYEGDFRFGEHNSIPMVRLMHRSMQTMHIAGASTRIVLCHMAMELHKTYEETCELVKKDGFIVSHDGMILNI